MLDIKFTSLLASLVVSAMSVKTYGLVMAVAIVMLAYWLYEPLFPEMDHVWKIRSFCAIKKIVNVVGFVSESLGYMSSINMTRFAMKAFIQQPVFASVEIVNENFSGVPVRIFRPIRKDKSSSDELPGLMYFHGGGWVNLDIDAYHSLTARIANKTGFVVVSVDYHRAPENIFPIPFDDCLTATVHLLRNGKDYGVDVTEIAVSGDSAGGNLAAAVSLRLAVETGLPTLKAQVLIYPALQAFDFRTPSMLTRNVPEFLTQEIMIRYWLLYYQGHTDNMEKFRSNNHTSALLKASEYGDAVDHSLLPEEFQKQLTEKPRKNFGDEKVSDLFEPTLLNPYFCPLLAQRLDKLPPTFMITAEYDVLRDDGFMYAERLERVGVTVKHKHFQNFFHGFISLEETDGQKMFLDDLSKFLHETIL